MTNTKIRVVSAVAASLCVLYGAVWKLNSVRSAVKHMAKSEKQEEAVKSYITYEDWLNGTFRAKSFYPRWINENQYSHWKEDKSIVLIDKDGNETTLLNASAVTSLTNPTYYLISADVKYVAVAYNSSTGYAAYMTFYSIAVFRASHSTQIDIPGDLLHDVQKIKWDPVGHKMAFVKNFDVYVTDVDTRVDQVTDDGKENVKFNGLTDYPTDTAITDALLWWSPNATYLAYATMDYASVKNITYAMFNTGPYPNMISVPYPMPGTPLPATKTFVYDPVIEGPAVELEPSSKITEWGEYYLNLAIWRSDGIFTPVWKNRMQNESVSETCESDGSTWACDHVSVMESKSTSGWLGHYRPADIVVTPLSNEYITVLSDSTGFYHVAVINTDFENIDWRTNGTFEVADGSSGDSPIYFYDPINDWVYFTSTENPDQPTVGLPRIRHLWRVKGHGGDRNRECITCDLNKSGKTMKRCNWVTPSFSPDGTLVVVNCGGTANGAPISTRHEISRDGTVGAAKIVEDNSMLVQNLNKYHFRVAEFGNITLPDLPEEVFYYTMHKPPNFDESKSYPMLVFVYSGPASQYTTDSYYADWSRGYLASSDLDVIVVTFDGRGTGFRGDNIMHKVYLNLGKYEPIDQIEAARQISRASDFIDNDRIAIWGRSYGGYATARTIGEDVNTVFKCGISVAPVTDWQTYHQIYTERLMTTPDINQVGYNESTAIQKLDNFRKHYYALVHGTSDGNVHFLNSARLSKALIEADVDFTAYFAGDETHSFNRYPNSYGHHYKLLTRYVKRCLDI